MEEDVFLDNKFSKEFVLSAEKHKDKLIRAVFYAYKRLYEIAGSDFIKLVEVSPIDEEGRIDIPFMNYNVSQEDYDKVIKEVKTKFKLNKQQLNALSIEVCLGCSPEIKWKL